MSIAFACQGLTHRYSLRGGGHLVTLRDVTFDARTEAQRNPNAALRVQVDLAPKLSAALRPLQPTV